MRILGPRISGPSESSGAPSCPPCLCRWPAHVSSLVGLEPDSLFSNRTNTDDTEHELRTSVGAVMMPVARKVRLVIWLEDRSGMRWWLWVRLWLHVLGRWLYGKQQLDTPFLEARFEELLVSKDDYRGVGPSHAHQCQRESITEWRVGVIGSHRVALHGNCTQCPPGASDE